MHSGKDYHEFTLSSTRDRKARERFQCEALRLLPPRATILDFGAGTGIDAKVYAAHGHRVFVHEPSESMWAYLARYCRDELNDGRIVRSDLATTPPVHLITANFAVLNLISNRHELFEQLARVAVERGFLLASLLNPYFLGDARYSWWRRNLGALAKCGSYSVPGESGPIFRLTPGRAGHEAAPGFRVADVNPGYAGLPFCQYIFILFRRD